METSERIQHKAYELFRRYGIRSVTMDEIAGQCGVSKKTVYQFFEDKDSLVESIVAKVINQSETQCNIDQDRCENAVHEIFLAMEMVLQVFSGMNPAIMYEMQRYHPKSFKLLEDHKMEFMYRCVKQNLERGIAEGLYRPEINMEIITRLHLQNMFLPFDQDVFPKTRFSIAEVDMEIMDHYLHGVANNKGIKQIEKYKQQRLIQQTQTV